MGQCCSYDPELNMAEINRLTMELHNAILNEERRVNEQTNEIYELTYQLRTLIRNNPNSISQINDDIAIQRRRRNILPVETTAQVQVEGEIVQATTNSEPIIITFTVSDLQNETEQEQEQDRDQDRNQ